MNFADTKLDAEHDENKLLVHCVVPDISKHDLSLAGVVLLLLLVVVVVSDNT